MPSTGRLSRSLAQQRRAEGLGFLAIRLHGWFEVTDPDEVIALAEEAVRLALELGVVSEVVEAPGREDED